MKHYAVCILIFLATSLLSCSQIEDAGNTLDELASSVSSQVVIGVLVSDGTEVLPFSQESGGKELTVKVTGEHKDIVTGKVESDLSLGTYVVDTNIIKPSDDEPIEFTLIFKAPGYLTTSKTYYIVENKTIFDHVILTNLAADNAGVDSAVVTKGSASNGVVSEELAIATEGNKAAITVPEGVRLLSAEGTALEGELTTTIAHFDAGDPRSLAAFPGGLKTRATKSDGSTEPVNFISAGFVSIDISDENGNSAHTIEDGEIDVAIAAASTTYNPETGAPLAVDDEIPLWSFNEDSGEWEYEKVSYAQSMYLPGTKSGQKSLGVKTKLHHLSSYNLDFHTDSCRTSVRIKLERSTRTQIQLELIGDIDDSRGRTIHEFIPIAEKERSLVLQNAPKNVKVRLRQGEPLPEDASEIEMLIFLVRQLLAGRSDDIPEDGIEIENLCDKTRDQTLILTQ